MLAGKKPLAVFHDVIESLPNEIIIPEEKFSPYVINGSIIKEEAIFAKKYRTKEEVIKFVLYAVKGEEWRIPAYLMVKRTFNKTGRNPEELERIESELLGYTQEEIDAWCQQLYGSRNAT